MREKCLRERIFADRWKNRKNAKIRTTPNFVTHGSPQGLSIAQPFSAEKEFFEGITIGFNPDQMESRAG